MRSSKPTPDLVYPSWISVFTITLVVLLSGCSKRSDSVTRSDARSRTDSAAVESGHSTSPTSSPAHRPDKLKFRDAKGQTLFSIKFREDGAKLVDGQEKEIAKLKIEPHPEGAELKIKSPDEKTLGYVIGGSPKWKLKDADKKTVLFEMRIEADGIYKIEDGSQNTLYRIRSADGGAEIKDGSGAVVAKVIAKNGRRVVQDAMGNSIVMTTDTISPVQMACFGLDRLTQPQRAGLFMAMSGRIER